MASVNQTRLHCVNQMGKTHYKPLAARHGRGTAWARHAVCESAFTVAMPEARGFAELLESCASFAGGAGSKKHEHGTCLTFLIIL